MSPKTQKSIFPQNDESNDSSFDEEIPSLHTLPNEVLLMILKNCNFLSLLALGQTNKGFRWSGLVMHAIRTKMPIYFSVILEGHYEDKFIPELIEPNDRNRLMVRCFWFNLTPTRASIAKLVVTSVIPTRSSCGTNCTRFTMNT